MPIELKEFLVNLKNWSFEFAPYKIDENEARKLTYAGAQLELKLLSLEKFSGKNKGKWIPIDTINCWNECSVCGDSTYVRSLYCPNCGARMESD